MKNPTYATRQRQLIEELQELAGFVIGDMVTWKPDHRHADFVEKFGDGPFEVVDLKEQYHPHMHKKGGSGKPLTIVRLSDGSTGRIGATHLIRVPK